MQVKSGLSEVKVAPWGMVRIEYGTFLVQLWLNNRTAGVGSGETTPGWQAGAKAASGEAGASVGTVVEVAGISVAVAEGRGTEVRVEVAAITGGGISLVGAGACATGFPLIERNN